MSTDLVDLLASSPLIASVQASPGSPLAEPHHLVALALASRDQGVSVFRLEGVESIRAIRDRLQMPVIGLIKRQYPESPVYITPTLDEVNQLVELGCEVIAVDGTQRLRPGGNTLHDLIGAIHRAGRFAMADCDTLASAQAAVAAGADCVGTTLAGYTEDSHATDGPDLELLRALCASLSVPVIAEGRYAEPWQVSAARQIGAVSVVIGGALNDPVKQTRAFRSAVAVPDSPVLAIDIGGTWLRGALAAPDGAIVETQRTALPPLRKDRLNWIRMLAEGWGTDVIGISSGGTIDPRTGVVIEAKDIIPDHIGTDFPAELAPHRVVALNDGLATAFAHASHPKWAGLRVATLALGTGVGFGLVDRGRIWMGRHGEYPRFNDLRLPDGRAMEDVLGGAALTAKPSEDQMQDARQAARLVADLIRDLYYPDALVLAGGVGLAPWLDLGFPTSPYGADAGLYGAAAIARYPRAW